MELDVSGLVCPQPVLVVRRCLAELDVGQELVVTGDHPPAHRSISRTCYRHGFDVETVSPTGDDESFTVRIGVTDESSQTDRDVSDAGSVADFDP